MQNLTEEQKEYLGVVDERKELYFQVENAVIDGYKAMEKDKKTKELKEVKKSYFDNAHEIVLYTALSRYCNNNTIGFPSLQTLCIVCCCSKNTILKAMKSLEEKGFIKKLKRKNKETNGDQSNLYAVKNINEINISAKGSSLDEQGGSSSDEQGGSSPDEHKEKQVIKKNNIKEKQIMKEHEHDFFENLFKKIGVNFTNKNQESVKKLLKKQSLEEVKEYLIETYENIKATPGIKNTSGAFSTKIAKGDRQEKYKAIEVNEEKEEIVKLTKEQKIKLEKENTSEKNLKELYKQIEDELKACGVTGDNFVECEVNEILYRRFNKKMKKAV